MTGVGRYLIGLIAVAAAFEGCCRHFQPLLRAASHRGLFKAALLERRLPQDIVFFGTSRTGEALRPGAVVSSLEGKGAPRLSAFNLSVQYSSLEILEDVTRRFASTGQLKVAVIEISRNQLARAPLPWAPPSARTDPDFESKASAWVEGHSALVAERKVFVLDSVARLAAASLFGSRYDGTEQFGADYIGPIFGRSHDVDSSQFLPLDCRPRPVDSPSGQLAELAEERDVYAAIARAFTSHGVGVAFYVPPTLAAGEGPENSAAQRAMRASLQAATGAPVWDFANCALPPSYFREPIHLSHLGGSHFSRFVARSIAEDPALSRKLGIAVP